MKYINSESHHPDLRYRDKYDFTLKSHILGELESLEKIESHSPLELMYIEQKKLELFHRIFGF